MVEYGIPRDHVVGSSEPPLPQILLRVGGGSLDHVEPVVAQGAGEIAGEVPVGVDRDQRAVGAQPPEDLPGDRPDTGPVLDDRGGLAQST